MKIATWNVNSVRARLPVVQRWLQESQVDVLAMQETKTVDETFPFAEFESLGYQVTMSGKKAYNDDQIEFSLPVIKVVMGRAGNDPSRILAVDVGDVTLIDGYLSHGGERGDEAFLHKLQFFQEFREYLDTTYSRDHRLLFMGDFNVARDPQDVWAPDEMQDAIGFMHEEREALENLRAWGFDDLFRKFHSEQQFTWWDYRMNMFKRHIGMRIDYAWGCL